MSTQMDTRQEAGHSDVAGSKVLSRRDLLKQASSVGLGIGLSLVAGSGFLASSDAAWAVEVVHLKPRTMAVLLQMARDIYPHDRIGDSYYAIAVKGYDSESSAASTEASVVALDNLSGGDYLSLGWEKQRVSVLQKIEHTSFFQNMRGGLVTGLYNQKAVWGIFGYEGESYSKGGYLYRGFDDINWL